MPRKLSKHEFFSYPEGKDSNNWHLIMAKMEKHGIGEVNEVYEQYCFNKRDKLPTKSVHCFVAELSYLVLSGIALCLELKMSRLPRSYLEFEI